MTKKKIKDIATVGITLILCIGVIGISYSAFIYSEVGKKENKITTGAITMLYTESNNTISISNVLPTTDNTGKARKTNGEYFDFTVKSSITGNTDINYEIAAKEETGNTFSGNNIKYYLTTVDSTGKETEVMAPRTYYEESSGNVYTGRPADMMSLYTGNLKEQGDTTINYRLRLWVDEYYNPQGDDEGLIYKVKVNVYGQTSDTVAKAEDKYCQENGFTTLSDCMLVMNNHEKNVEEAKTAIKAKETPDFNKIAPNDTETDGLYMAEDDEGESYYYRGAVRKNYVSFAGFIWKIIRRNGDGSVRMIYSGKSAFDTSTATTIGSSTFNSKSFDSTYAGYKYNEDFSLHESNGTTWYNMPTNTQKYNFGTGYTFDEPTKKFTLTGDIKELTWKENHDEIVNNQLYSCLNTSCDVVYKITGYRDGTTMVVQPISYSSNSLLTAQTNTRDSTIKTELDNWYRENLIDYSSYLADETFCNDRSIMVGTGYKVDSYTFYGAYTRIQENRNPSLKCSQDNDKFKISNESAKLNYPIGLILVDEVALAGGKAYYNGAVSPNSNYYLYNTDYYWTFSPSLFVPETTSVELFSVTNEGGIETYTYADNSRGIRPVINLKKEVTISKGDGSSLNPFVIN